MDRVLIINMNNSDSGKLVAELEYDYEIINISETPEELFSASSVIINPGFSGSVEESLKEVFLCLKEIYPLLMQNKGVNLWIAEPDLSECSGNIDNRCYLEGIKSLSRLAAMELATKSVSVNFLAGNKDGYLGLSGLMAWSRTRGKIYLTGQLINS